MQVSNIMNKTNKIRKGSVKVGGVSESVPRLFSDKNEGTCIYLAVFTDNICASSVTNLAYTATQEQSEAPTQICLETQQSLYCSSSGRRFEEEVHCVSLQFSYYCAIISLRTEHRSVPAFSRAILSVFEQRNREPFMTLQISIEFAIQSHEAEDGEPEPVQQFLTNLPLVYF